LVYANLEIIIHVVYLLAFKLDLLLLFPGG